MFAQRTVGKNLDLRLDKLVCNQVQLYDLKAGFVEDYLLNILESLAPKGHFHFGAALCAGRRDRFQHGGHRARREASRKQSGECQTTGQA